MWLHRITASCQHINNQHGITSSWHHIIMASHHHDITASRHHRIVASHQQGITPSWHHGVTSSWYHIIMASHHHSITSSWHLSIISSQHSDIKSYLLIAISHSLGFSNITRSCCKRHKTSRKFFVSIDLTSNPVTFFLFSYDQK